MKDVLERLERKMDASLQRLERKMDAGFARVDERFARVDQRFARVDEGFARVDERFARVDEGFARVDRQLQKQGVLLESVTGDVKMALEGIIGNRQVLDQKFAEVLEKLDQRIQPVELATRDLAAKTTQPR